MKSSWPDFLANNFLHKPASRISHLFGHRKISQRGSRTISNVDGSTSAHRWTQALSDWYKAQKGAVATVRSPVAAFESESPSVRKEDVENAIFLDPLLYSTIVFTAWSQCSYHVSGIPFGWFWLRTLCKYWVTIQLFNNFSEVDALFRHAESSGCTGWCFLITVAMVPASILTLTITACLLFWLQSSTNWPQNNLSPCNLEGLDRTSITEHC